jgi:Kelch motif
MMLAAVISVVESVYAWTLMTSAAAYHPRDGARLICIGTRLYMLGGWNVGLGSPWLAGWPAGTTNEIWYSDDAGATWSLLLGHSATTLTRWRPRHEFGCVVMNGYVYVVGGDNNSGIYQRDVWRAPVGDLTSWTQMTADWGGPGNRALYQVWARDGALYLAGGQTVRELSGELSETYYNDVWRSTTLGATWAQIATGAPITDHNAGSNTLFSGRQVIVGGGQYHNFFAAKVRSTVDGINFTEHADLPFGGRYYNDVAVYDGWLWTFGGVSNTDQFGATINTANGGATPHPFSANRGDLWRTRNLTRWTLHDAPVVGAGYVDTDTSPPAPTHATAFCAHPTGLICAAGNSFTKDVYRLSRAA